MRGLGRHCKASFSSVARGALTKGRSSSRLFWPICRRAAATLVAGSVHGLPTRDAVLRPPSSGCRVDSFSWTACISWTFLKSGGLDSPCLPPISCTRPGWSSCPVLGRCLPRYGYPESPKQGAPARAQSSQTQRSCYAGGHNPHDPPAGDSGRVQLVNNIAPAPAPASTGGETSARESAMEVDAEALEAKQKPESALTPEAWQPLNIIELL